MTRAPRLVTALLALGLGGCASAPGPVAAPPPLVVAPLSLPLGRTPARRGAALAVGPVGLARGASRRASAAPGGAEAAPSTLGGAEAAPSPLGEAAPAPPMTAVASAANDGRGFALPLERDDVEAWTLEAAGATGLFEGEALLLPRAAEDLEAAAVEAERRGADLLLSLGETACRARFVRDDGLVWWASLAVYCVAGPPFAWWIPDEVFELRLQAEVEVRHVRTRALLLRVPLDVSAEASLDDFEHGWVLLSPLRVPGAMGPDDWLAVGRTLQPALRAAVARELRRALAAGLPPALETDEARRLLRDGTPERARTFAVVVGADGPEAGRNRARFARRDAQAVAAFLVRHGVREEDVTLLVDVAATRPRLAAALSELTRRTLGLDQVVVYFAGLGATIPGAGGGAPRTALVLADADEASLAGTALPLAELAGLCEGLLAGRVTFVLDASFGGAGGRTFPGGAAPDAGTYLAELGDAARGFTVLAAAGPTEAAREADSERPAEQHGLFTFYLLRTRDEDGDGRLAFAEVEAALHPGVSTGALAFWGALQEPLRVGAVGHLVERGAEAP